MSRYEAPLEDLNFIFEHLLDNERLVALPGFEDLSTELIGAILEEAGRFASGVLAPLNATGDREGVRWSDGEVATPEGFKEAYRQYVESGWNNVAVEKEYGGQGLPYAVSMAIGEIMMAANKSLVMCPGLTLGAIESLCAAASPEQKALYLPNLVSGRWSGTMNLTEPDAGSDVGALRCKAIEQADGSYRLHGQKIFISYGEHDLTENIVHLVLARTPDAPEGVKGISLFLVPKFLVNPDGSLGARNDVRCVSTEHKLGIHGSPTCVLAYGDREGATGYLVGEKNRGLQAMFVMMNMARLIVGLEGVALSERAYQQALDYARERIQGVDALSGEPVAIVRHPDVRRMLLSMKSQIEAMRALSLVIAQAQDLAQRHADPEVRRCNQAFVELLTPVFKAWATENGIRLTQLGVQIHGGMGFVEETGAAQHLRDAVIGVIYEGTTGIQAADLVGRKLARDGGAAFAALLRDMSDVAEELQRHRDLGDIGSGLAGGIASLRQAGEHILPLYRDDAQAALAVSVPFLMLAGTVAGAWQHGRGALAAARLIEARGEPGAFLKGKLVSARFYVAHVLVQALALAETVRCGAAPVAESADFLC
ncbi:acyl-CoA dehydrogenase [Azotobacter vinelandii]|uniref:acyl-CoA dehydrogenase n=1 Tax=Azotobacter vinelandii TaxID=354 RepID=UPI0026666AB0|nr:acyl-CoA dehydrogenase [Azotobacter vinelandii]WKN23683.1 acyl-CoA dehydrogenase [Azotobacter vinelandii]